MTQHFKAKRRRNKQQLSKFASEHDQEFQEGELDCIFKIGEDGLGRNGTESISWRVPTKVG